MGSKLKELMQKGCTGLSCVTHSGVSMYAIDREQVLVYMRSKGLLDEDTG